MPDKKNSLYVLWTTADLITVEKMVFMYTLNAKIQGWFDAVTLVVWGASTKLLADNSTLQERIEEMKAAGIRVEACKACADQLGATEALESCQVEVKYWGEPLTEVLKSRTSLITI
jgi:hypothetical protein